MEKDIQSVSTDYDKLAKWLITLAVEVADKRLSEENALSSVDGMTLQMTEESRQAIRARFLHMIGKNELVKCDEKCFVKTHGHCDGQCKSDSDLTRQLKALPHEKLIQVAHAMQPGSVVRDLGRKVGLEENELAAWEKWLQHRSMEQ